MNAAKVYSNKKPDLITRYKKIIQEVCSIFLLVYILTLYCAMGLSGCSTYKGRDLGNELPTAKGTEQLFAIVKSKILEIESRVFENCHYSMQTRYQY